VALHIESAGPWHGSLRIAPPGALNWPRTG
jgi:hypothetical protein